MNKLSSREASGSEEERKFERKIKNSKKSFQKRLTKVIEMWYYRQALTER